MSNFAALIDVLSIAGSRKSDGSANDSGTVWFFQPGTNTEVDVYSDAAASAVITQPITLTDGGLVSRSDYPNGIFATQPLRLLIQDSDGNTVGDLNYIPASAGNVGVDNVGFTGTTQDEVLTAAFTSFGGTDWTVKESNGATARTLKSKVFEAGISVKDFGAVGDGVAIDTTAIQAAMNRAKALSTNVLFPAGTYKTDQALTLSAAAGVRLIGQGRGVTIIAPTHGTANCFTISASAASGVVGMSIRHTSGSTGSAIAISGASTSVVLRDLDIPAGATYVGFAYAIDFSGASDFDEIAFCAINADTVALRADCSSSVGEHVILGCDIGSSSGAPVSPVSGLEFNGSIGQLTIVGCNITGATNNVLFNAAWTGVGVRIIGGDLGSVLGSTEVNLSGFAADRDVRLIQCGVDGYVTSQASGGGGGSSFTPNRAKGHEAHIRLTSGGAAVLNVGAPTPAPSLGSVRDITLRLRITGAAGGDITATFDAVYILVGGGATITVTNGTTATVMFNWDAQTSEWREEYRSATAT